MKLTIRKLLINLIFYIKSGMTIRKAWFKIAGEYEKDQKRKNRYLLKRAAGKKLMKKWLM